MNPKVLDLDVVMPLHGQLPWLVPALKSLAAQSGQPGRCLLIDDGISDVRAVRATAEGLLGDRVILVPNRGSGISAALNTGARLSDATWVARMDADDVAYPDRLQKQYAWLQRQSAGTVACGAQVNLVSVDGKRLQRSNYPADDAAYRAQRLSRTCFAHPTLVIRRDVLLQTPYRSPLDGAEDVDLMLRLSEKGRVGNLPQALLDYRIREHQVSAPYRARQTALQELAFRLAEQRRKHGVDVLDGSPEIADDFVAWRIGQPGYADARQLLTAMRYCVYHLRGFDTPAAARHLRKALQTRPWRRSTRQWIARISATGAGELRHDALSDRLAILDTNPVSR